MKKILVILLVQVIGFGLLYAAYDELYRPQYHFSANTGWVGDPDGLVRYDGNYHLFWWSHAMSKDLVYWQELPWGMPSLTSGFDYYSGGMVIDLANVSGLKSGEYPPALAFYTKHENSTGLEGPALSFSNEYINNYTNFVHFDNSNPIAGSLKVGYRDPQVFKDPSSGLWIMIVANNSDAGFKHIEILKSTDLKSWTWIANYSAGSYWYECPDLFQINDENGNPRWVLMYGRDKQTYYQFAVLNPSAASEWDRFHTTSDPQLLDNGWDYYAARIYRDYDGDESRVLSMAWMGNWDYNTEVDNLISWGPGQMALPRQLTVKTINGTERLVQKPVSALQKLRKDSVINEPFEFSQPWGLLPNFQPESNQYELFISFDTNNADNTNVSLNFCFSANPNYNKVILHYIESENRFWLDRRYSDNTAQTGSNFNGTAFASESSALIYPDENGIVSFRVFVDKSSIEVFGNEGETSITSQIFPLEGSIAIEASTDACIARVNSLKGYNLNSIWSTTTKEKQSIYNKVIFDGERVKPHFYSLGGNPPNGTDMGPETWQLTLNDESVVSILEPEFNNPIKKGINTSDKVMRFYRSKDGKSWSGCALGNLLPESSNTWAITLKINKAVAGKVVVKLEGGTNADGNPGSEEVVADYSTPGEWAKLRFGFNNWNFSQGEPTTILIFPHYENTDLSPLTEAIPVYIDDVEIRNDVLLSTDMFRTKASGNWSELGTWKSAMADNASWQWDAGSSEFIPGLNSTNVRVQNGHVLTVNTNASTESIVVEPTGKLTLNEGNTLSVGSLKMESSSDGSASFVDNSVNGLNVINSSDVIQYLNAARSWYVSSPIQNATTNMINPNPSMIASFNESNNNWNLLTDSTSIKTGRGYITNVNSSRDIDFSGILNTGNVSVGLTANNQKFNLVGNPYPSYLNFDLLAEMNSNIYDTFWFRTQNTNGEYLFATYNASSGLVVAPSANTGIYNLIPPMQAFWVRSVNANASVLTFTNQMRAHPVHSDNKLKAPSNGTNSYIRLQVSSDNKIDETLIYFNENASDSFDSFDSEKMFSSSNNPEIWTSVDNSKLVINGLNAIKDSISVPVHIQNINQKYTVKITEKANVPENTEILFTNLTNGQTIDLRNESQFLYEPNTTGLENFSLKLKLPETITNLNSDFKRENVQINIGGQLISLDVNTRENINLKLQNLSAKTIWSKNFPVLPSYLDLEVENGIYILTCMSANNVNTQKLIIK